MNDAPNAQELLEAVAAVLSQQVLLETDGGTRHTVRIAANLCQVIARELGSTGSGDIDRQLADLLGVPADKELARRLDERLRGNDHEFDAAVGEHLFADVCRRVDIAKPGYRIVDE